MILRLTMSAGNMAWLITNNQVRSSTEIFGGRHVWPHHIGRLAVRGDPFRRIPELPEVARRALLSHLKFCELGAVSPDYPYLVLGNKDAAGCANVMHCWRTADFIRNGVRHLLDLAALDSHDGQQCLAWLFGYASHVVADLTFIPSSPLPFPNSKPRPPPLEITAGVLLPQRTLQTLPSILTSPGGTHRIS